MRATNLLSVVVIAGVILTGLVKPASAQDELTFNRQTPIVKVYEKTHKAVVNIAGEGTVPTSIRPGFDWPDMFDFWVPWFQRQVRVLGSGVVVHEDGYIITNEHVIKGAEKIKVLFSDGSEFPAEIKTADENKDLAVLIIKTEDKLPFIHLGRSDDLMIGETVIAIGNPYGYANTVTSGVISAVGRDVEISKGSWLRGLIQTDAPINPGNSGGPLLNINGELIGINTAIRAEAENIGFAIPVDTLTDNLIHMLMPEKLRRVQLGLVMGRMKAVGKFTGLAVDSVIKESPAEKNGIAAGDIVLEIDGQKLNGVIDFYIKIMDKQIGQPILIKYVRTQSSHPQSRTAKLTLVAKPLPDGRQLARKFFQMEVSELNEKVAEKFNFESAYPIMIITDVERGGIAAEAGIERGDLIEAVNNAIVSNLKEFSLEMEKINEGDVVKLNIIRLRIGAFGQMRQQTTVPLKAKSKKNKSASIFVTGDYKQTT